MDGIEEALTPSEEAQLRGDDAAATEQRDTQAPAAGGQPEQAPEQQAEQGAEGDSRPKMVPHGAFHEERELRKSLQKDLAAEREARIRLEERTNAILRSMQPPAQQEQAPPDPETDPIGALKYEREQRAKLEQFQREQAQQVHRQQQFETVRSHILAEEAKFAATTPDYHQAANYLRGSRAEEMRLVGVPEHMIEAHLRQEAVAIAHTAQQFGKSPAEIYYNLAKLRGYAPKGAAQSSATEKIDTLAAQQRAGSPLANANGAPTGQLTAQRLAEMSDEDFAKISEAQFRQIMGG